MKPALKTIIVGSSYSTLKYTFILLQEASSSVSEHGYAILLYYGAVNYI